MKESKATMQSKEALAKPLESWSTKESYVSRERVCLSIPAILYYWWGAVHGRSGLHAYAMMDFRHSIWCSHSFELSGWEVCEA